VNRPFLVIAAVTIACWLPSIAQAVELPRALMLGEQKLVLNGTGTREKYFLDVYETGLYLAERSSAAAEIVEADAPMVIRIAITSKLVTQEKLVKSLEEGFEASTDGKLEPLSAEIEKFRQCLAGELSRDDVFDLIYIPDHGVLVSKNGKPTGSVAGLEFKRALFGIWLGERPVNDELKEGLLGGNETRRR
jgi:hypothetical protein